MVFTLLVFKVSKIGLLTLSYLNVAAFILLGLESIVFLSRLRADIITTIGVLLLNTVLVYSSSEIYKGLKKVLNQEEPTFRSEE